MAGKYELKFECADGLKVTLSGEGREKVTQAGRAYVGDEGSIDAILYYQGGSEHLTLWHPTQEGA